MFVKEKNAGYEELKPDEDLTKNLMSKPLSWIGRAM